jgi:hypothetical protein
VERLQGRSEDVEDSQGLAVVSVVLSRLSRVSERLVRTIQLQDQAAPFDVNAPGPAPQRVP